MNYNNQTPPQYQAHAGKEIQNLIAIFGALCMNVGIPSYLYFLRSSAPTVTSTLITGVISVVAMIVSLAFLSLSVRQSPEYSTTRCFYLLASIILGVILPIAIIHISIENNSTFFWIVNSVVIIIAMICSLAILGISKFKQ